MTKHLDLGCGPKPRNPYACDELFGVDLGVAQSSAHFKQANLAVQGIPFADDHFDSVSAYDFLEHIPRVLPTPDGLGTRAPFIELMNEIWRVLVPGGRLYAQTPAFPHEAAFQDPTHVNVIAWDTYAYFAQPLLAAKHYGFHGCFDAIRVSWLDPTRDYEPPRATFFDKLRHRLSVATHQHSHLLWELEAVKP